MTYRAYKIRLYPTTKQRQQIAHTLGCSRFVYNYFLNIKQLVYKKSGKSISRFKCQKMLTALKKGKTFLKYADSSALNISLLNLDKAYTNLFKQHAGYPKFKKKHNCIQTYSTQCCHIKLKDGKQLVHLGKLGEVKYRSGYDSIDGKVVSGTICRRGRGKHAKYYLSILCDVNNMKQLPKTGKQVGLDLGIKTLVTTSDGKKLGRNKPYKKQLKQQRRLKRLQRRLSKKQLHTKARKQKASNNYKKLQSKINLLYEKINNSKQDHLHKITTWLVNNYDVICVENLAVKNMMKNHHIAGKMQQLSLSEILRMLAYKCEWCNKKLMVVNRFFASSQLCSKCGYKNAKVKNLSVRRWRCPICGRLHNRDKNAAINILQEGLRMLNT